MYGKEDERQVLTTFDIQKTLRTQLYYNLLFILLGFFCSCLLVPNSIRLIAEFFTIKQDGFFIMAVLFAIVFFAVTLLIGAWTVISIIWFVKEHRIITNCYFRVVEDTVERAGPEDTEHFTYSPFIRRRDVYWNSGDTLAQKEGKVVGKYLNRRFVYPIHFSKYGRAIYDTFKWKMYLGEGDKCLLVIYDKDLYPGDCNIVRIYPSIMYRYQK